MIGGHADCLSRVKGNLHARFLGEGGQRCSALTRQISLTWYTDTTESEIFFNGRVQKMESVLSGMTSTYFLYHLAKFLPAEYAAKLPHFDARVWNVPTLEEGANCFLWREWDATKNSISMAAQHSWAKLPTGSRSSTTARNPSLAARSNLYDPGNNAWVVLFYGQGGSYDLEN